MKNIEKILLLVLVTFLPCFQTTLMADEPEEIPIKKGTVFVPNSSPKSIPSSNTKEYEPTCQYYNGEVTIIADIDITYISACVTRLDDSMQWSNAGAGNTLSISVSTDPGTYLLTLTLSDGRSYYGEYTLY